MACGCTFVHNDAAVLSVCFFPYKYLAVIICENDHPIRRVFEEMVRRH